MNSIFGRWFQSGPETKQQVVHHARSEQPAQSTFPCAERPTQRKTITDDSATCNDCPQLSGGALGDNLMLEGASSEGAEARLSYANLLRSRHTSLRARAEAQISLHRYVELQSAANRSQQHFIEILRNAKCQGEWESHLDQLNQASDQVETDWRLMSAQVARIKTSQGRLANLEYKMREQENNLFAALERLLRDCGVLNETSHCEAWLLDAIHEGLQSSASTSLDSRLERYYDKAGDLGLLNDKLSALEIEHQEQLATRQFLAEQDRPLSPSPRQFDQLYQKDWAVIAQQRKEAARVAELARDACLSAGLHPDGSQLSTSEPACSSEKESGERHSGVFQHLELGEKQIEAMPRSRSLLTAELLRQQNFSSCRDAVQTGEQRQESAHIEDWRLRLSMTPQDPICALDAQHVRAMRNFGEDLQASIQSTNKPRRRRSTTHLCHLNVGEAHTELSENERFPPILMKPGSLDLTQRRGNAADRMVD